MGIKSVSVIICSHNPRREYLSRTLHALRHQSLDYNEWELIIVDNASHTKISDIYDVSWHPQAAVLVEEQLGLTHARLKGISEAKGDLLVFFDDDNVPAFDYLERATSIAGKYDHIGCFGGNIAGEFEASPPNWMLPHLSRLAVRDVNRNVWSNLYEWHTTPAGAGMAIRADIAKQYAANVLNDPLRKALDRKGANTMSAGDIDMAYTAIDQGYCCGLFKELKLTHIIPKERVEEKYLIRLYEGILISHYILNALRNIPNKPPAKITIREKLKRIYRYLFKPPVVFKLQEAKLRAPHKAQKIIDTVSNMHNTQLIS